VFLGRLLCLPFVVSSTVSHAINIEIDLEDDSELRIRFFNDETLLFYFKIQYTLSVRGVTFLKSAVNGKTAMREVQSSWEKWASGNQRHTKHGTKYV
jgi:hypothetical protein